MIGLPSICLRGLGMITGCAMLLLSGGCERAPQTAAELAAKLPREFTGELHLQGDADTRRVRVRPGEVSVTSEHLLQIGRIDYEIDDAKGVEVAAGEAGIRVTISAPGLEIRVETIGAGAGDAIRPETFSGKLGGDLRSVEAEWSTSLGQKARLKMQAAQP